MDMEAKMILANRLFWAGCATWILTILVSLLFLVMDQSTAERGFGAMMAFGFGMFFSFIISTICWGIGAWLAGSVSLAAKGLYVIGGLFVLLVLVNIVARIFGH